MCDPMTMFAAAGAGLQVAGQVSQGRAAQRQANAAATEDEYQAAVERSNALAEAATIRRAGARQRGETLAGIASSGVKIGEGSALDAERQVMEDVERDAYMTILTGERRGSAFEREAANKRRAGRDARRAANIGAFSSLLSAGANYARASGWGARGPGFSGTQPPAPVEDRSNRGFGGYGGRY